MVAITGMTTYDIRLPTSRLLDGSDAMNTDPDYTAAYCVLNNRLPDLLWKAVLSLRRQRNEPGHPVGLEAGGPAVLRTFGCAGPTGEFGG